MYREILFLPFYRGCSLSWWTPLQCRSRLFSLIWFWGYRSCFTVWDPCALFYWGVDDWCKERLDWKYRRLLLLKISYALWNRRKAIDLWSARWQHRNIFGPLEAHIVSLYWGGPFLWVFQISWEVFVRGWVLCFCRLFWCSRCIQSGLIYLWRQLHMCLLLSFLPVCTIFLYSWLAYVLPFVCRRRNWNLLGPDRNFICL